MYILNYLNANEWEWEKYVLGEDVKIFYIFSIDFTETLKYIVMVILIHICMEKRVMFLLELYISVGFNLMCLSWQFGSFFLTRISKYSLLCLLFLIFF